MRLLPFVVLIWVLTPCLAYAQSDKIGAQINQSLRNFNKDEDANVQGQSDEITDLVKQGLRHYKKGEFAKAVGVAKRAIALAMKKYGAEHPSVATLLNALGVLSESQGQFEEAERLYKRALAMREKALAVGHPDIAQSLNNLAGLYETQGRLTDAEPLYKRSLAIWEKALGPGTKLVASAKGADFPSNSRMETIALIAMDQGSKRLRYGGSGSNGTVMPLLKPHYPRLRR